MTNTVLLFIFLYGDIFLSTCEIYIKFRSRETTHVAISLRWSVNQLLTCLYKDNYNLSLQIADQLLLSKEEYCLFLRSHKFVRNDLNSFFDLALIGDC